MKPRSNPRAVYFIASALFLGVGTSAPALPLGSRAAPKVETRHEVIVAGGMHRKRVTSHGPVYVDRRRMNRGFPPAECPGLHSWNPANPDRGFCDPGFAYHGNVNGCAFDEGYGRWSSCDGLR